MTFSTVVDDDTGFLAARSMEACRDALIRFDRRMTERKDARAGYESQDIPILETAPDVDSARYRQAKRKLLDLSTARGLGKKGLL